MASTPPETDPALPLAPITSGESDDIAGAASPSIEALSASAGFPTPPALLELANSCVRFVERKLNFRLDYTPETLSVLDHYLREARTEVLTRNELAALVVQASGAYFGEVVRRAVASWWILPPGAPEGAWELQFQGAFLRIYPMEMALDLLLLNNDGTRTSSPFNPASAAGTSGLILDPEDREMLAARLALWPEVTEEEFHSLTQRFELIDFAVDVLSRANAAPNSDASNAETTIQTNEEASVDEPYASTQRFEPEDYEQP